MAQELMDRIAVALQSDAPQLHFNGFVTGYGPGDILVVLEKNGRSVAILNMSYTIAKTLANSLNMQISALEQTSGNTIMTTQDVEKYLKNLEDVGEK